MFVQILFYVLAAAAALAAMILGGLGMATALFPAKYVLAAVAAVLLLVLLLFLLCRKRKNQPVRSGRCVLGILLCLLIAGGEIVGIRYVGAANRTLNDVTGQTMQVSEIGAYVLQKDPAQTLQDAVKGGYRFGVCAGRDREAVQKAVAEWEALCGEELKLNEYPTLSALIRAMRDGETEAAIFNASYLEILEDLEEYAAITQELRCLLTTRVETAITRRQTDEEQDNFCMYISGIDTFGPVTSLSRSDVNILAVVNSDTKTLLLISTPRDFYVPFPFAGGERDKLTHAGVFGVERSVETMEELYQIPISYFVRMNFTGFVDIVDTMGGVDVNSEANFGSFGFSFVEGMNHLNGEEALAYSRCRHAFLDGDRRRGVHQMQVIQSLVRKGTRPEVLPKIPELMAELADCFQTDMPKSRVGKLVQRSLEPGDWKMLSYSVNGSDSFDRSYALDAFAYMMEPYTDTVEYAQSLIQTVLAGETLTQNGISKGAPKH